VDGLLSPPSHSGVRVGSVVEARALDFSYGRRAVFCSADFEITRGVVGLLGPNGAGKTTLLDLVVTLRAPAGGTLRVLGREVRGRGNVRELRRRIGYLPQSFGYHPRFTVREFVEYCGWLKEVPSGRLRQWADEAIASVDLTDRAGSPLRSLSGGMLRRVGIAQALVHRPDLLVLDEPTAGLDPAQRVELRGLVRRLAETSDVLLSTHLVEDVRAMCTRVMVLDAGRFVFGGTWQQLEAHARPELPGDSPLERGYSAVLAGESTR
jgi:ABC-2 type transport system ATP-binding protein